jgi:hypothetical protein
MNGDSSGRKDIWGDDEIDILKAGRTSIHKKTYKEIAEEIERKTGVVRTENALECKWRKIKKKLDEDGLEIDVDPVGTDKETIEVNEVGNTLTVHSKSKRIKTLAQLIEECEIDLDVWEIERHVINKWEVGAKTGPKYSQVIEIHPLFQVKAWLVKRKPTMLDPVVSPVYINVTLPKVAELKPTTGALHGMVWPDIQYGFRKSLRTAKLDPFHDRLALDVAIQIAADYPLSFGVYLGDLMDMADWTDKFARGPNFYWTTQPAAIEAKWWLTQFRMLHPNAKMTLVEGNHEARMPAQLIKHLKEGYGIRSVDGLHLPPLMSIPRILALHELDIEWVDEYPNGEVWINDYIVCEHGPIARGKSGATVSAYVQEVNETRIIGHTHRIECATRTIHERRGTRSASVWSVGCLCRIDGAVPAKRARVNWQQAVAMVEYFDDGRPDHRVIPIPIHNGKALFNGKLYEGRDRVEELRADTKKLYDLFDGEDEGWNF